MAGADFTIADVLAWARTKPADGDYSYGSNTNCALCQFLRETGRCDEPRAGGEYWRERDGEPFQHPLDRQLITALVAGTFGSLVTRLEALCPETVVTPSEWTKLDAYLTDIEQVSA